MSMSRLTIGASMMAVLSPASAPTSARLGTTTQVFAPTPALPPARPMEIGINASGSTYYGSERTYANLVNQSGGWRSTPSDMVQANGYPIAAGRIYLSIPQALWRGIPTKVTCTWAGSGKMFIDGNRSGETYGNHKLSVIWKPSKSGAPGSMFLNFSGGNPKDPLRDLDCREAGVVQNGPFDQRFVDDMKPYKVIRYLDWSRANGNSPISWATRALPDRLSGGSDGVPLEHQIDLANLTGADVWFTIPWNADETYVRNFATMVRDRLGARQRAYFELSNEVWNFGFPQATQALNEGLAEKLSPDKYTNNLLRYAEKSIWLHKILTKTFAATPKRLVRVIGIQSGNVWGLERIMRFRDAPAWIDAIATAPYFGHGMFGGANATVTDLPTLFASLETKRAAAIAQAVKVRVVAAALGKRSIAYEAGQHIVAPDKLELMGQMERSPEMGAAYARYLADWKAKVGDTIMIYSHTGSISRYGAWGIREYAGQPIGETPKRRAVLAAIEAR